MKTGYGSPPPLLVQFTLSDLVHLYIEIHEHNGPAWLEEELRLIIKRVLAPIAGGSVQ